MEFQFWGSLEYTKNKSMCEEGIKSLVEITESVGIKKKWVLIIMIYIDNTMHMERRSNISVYVVN